MDVMIWFGQTLAQNWRWFKNLKIQGIDSTFAEVLKILEENDCFFVGYGSGIKNILLGKIKEQSLLKIEGETTCDSFKLNEICSKNFGSDNCHAASVFAKNKIIFGNDRTSKDFNETLIEPISLFSWNSMLTTDRLKWGFTVNECGLLDNQSGDVYFIDYTTQSQMDICKHSVKIAVQPSYWKKWTNNNLIKILEVYNLVSNGFNVEEREYQFFIDFIKTNFNVV
uniref:Uncharacterized protein n=1 Tax=Panagrolaimus sp. ES5 TaxID=591445 RepID=A0AC34G4U0_9BILA